jgi:malate synthase
MKEFFEVHSYHQFIAPEFGEFLLKQAKPVPSIEELVQIGEENGLEDSDSFSFLVELYEKTKHQYIEMMKNRRVDRDFIDTRTSACDHYNKTWGLGPKDRFYRTVIGLEDARGRIVVGPQSKDFYRKGGNPVAPIPDYLRGYHVTIFGPPDSPKMAINAMNAYHRKLSGEPQIVEELLALNKEKFPIKWGADHEDSKTPIRSALVTAGMNLSQCIEGNLVYADETSQKNYALQKEKTALPIKRITGFALPCSFLFYRRNPIPLHLYEFALHLLRHWSQPEALVFYVPKIESEEEATYFRQVIHIAEDLIQKRHSSYKIGSVRLMIVLENPRAILRIHEIMDSLYPYFAGASLGWHDFLASTARLFKHDSQYRIPVKADPEIVIKYIRESHLLLADVVGSRGGIKIGGMYGILPAESDIRSQSFQVALRGFFKDVITQLKRDLTGFWVAHPDFVRIGLALVEAWKIRLTDENRALNIFIDQLLIPSFAQELKDWIEKYDGTGLDREDPQYLQTLLAADVGESSYIAHNDPREVRYNVFQSLQYFADWLSGNGCVALPTSIDDCNVRVMDDLATAERSRWEVWHEVYHGRFSGQDLVKIAFEELDFIRRNKREKDKVVQVSWDKRTEKWYPIALRVMLQLMTAKKPAEFATELLLDFTNEKVRNNQNPWKFIQEICPHKFRLEPFLERFVLFFELCGCKRFAEEMAKRPIYDPKEVSRIIQTFDLDEIREAAFFHGDIGQSTQSLDAMAREEQSKVDGDRELFGEELRTLGKKYTEKFGFKFLVSAKGRSGEELLAHLKERLNQSTNQEMSEARKALIEITEKRLLEHRPDFIRDDLKSIFRQSGVTGMSVALTEGGFIQSLHFGWAEKDVHPVEDRTRFELASLSKSLAAAFAMESFRKINIPLDSSVQKLLIAYKSPYRLRSSKDPAWVSSVTIRQLLNHTALSMHYVKGFPAHQPMPSIEELLHIPHSGQKTHPSGYDPIEIQSTPGSRFRYSGGGFIVLEHLIEIIEQRKILPLTRIFFDSMGFNDLTFEASVIINRTSSQENDDACGYDDRGLMIEGRRFNFPAFAAGARGTARSMLGFLQHLTYAYHNLEGSLLISHDTAVEMLHGQDLGSQDFMGTDMGLGVFVVEAGPNRFAVHQGANEGFRAIYIICYSGPDQGKGFVILGNAEEAAVELIADVARRLLTHLQVQGIEFEDSLDKSRSLDIPGSPENQVNIQFKRRIFDFFRPNLPEEISCKGPIDQLASLNLAVGAQILKVSNQKFARAENLISPHVPTFNPELFGAQGKIMDSWESRRHNPVGMDFMEFRLKKSCSIHYVQFSTEFHDGNHPELVRLFARAKNLGNDWVELLPRTSIKGHALLKIKLQINDPLKNILWEDVRVEMFPDGGLSRLGLFEDLPSEYQSEFLLPADAQSQRIKTPIPKSFRPLTIPFDSHFDSQGVIMGQAKNKLDIASAMMGATVIRSSNEHYGPSKQVVSPFPPLHMFDGLESRRSRNHDHHEEVEIKFGAPSLIRRIVADFSYFVNNNPVSMGFSCWVDDHWLEIVPKTNVKAFASLKKEWIIKTPIRSERLLVSLYPDGGVHRIHVYEE